MRIDEVTAADRPALLAMAKHLAEGTAVLTAGAIHPDLPTIHDVSHREGARLRVDTPVDHIWMGQFGADLNGQTITFYGGGAMYHSATFGWCPFTGPVEAAGYDFGAAKAAVDSLLAGLPEIKPLDAE